MTFSLTNWENTIKAELVRTEAAVESIVKNIANDVDVGLADLQGAGNWLAAHAPQIAQGILDAVTFATAISAPISPALLASVQAASSALTVFATAHNAGTSTPASIVQGYVAYQTATGSLSVAKAQAITTKTNQVIAAVSTAAQEVQAVASQSSSPIATAVGQVASDVTSVTATVTSPAQAQLGFPGV